MDLASKCRATSWAPWPPTKCGARSTTASPRSSARTAPRWSSSTRAACPSASPITWPSAWAKTPSCRITAACRAPCAWRPSGASRTASCAPWWPPPRSNWASISARVDLVCQIGSPRSIAVALQRIGRAGHWVGALPKGRLFATTRDELIECAALVRAIRRGELDRLEIPRNALDILAQQMVAACACEEFGEDELFDLVRRAWPYRTLERARFRRRAGRCSPKASPPRAAAAAPTCIATPSTAACAAAAARASPPSPPAAPFPRPRNTWWWPSPKAPPSARSTRISPWRAWPATSSCWAPPPGASAAWKPGRVRVEDAHGAAPAIPFWRGEAPGRTRELSREVARLARGDGRRRDRAFWQRECGLDRRGAEQAVDYVQAGAAALGAMPTDAPRRGRALLRRRRRHAAGHPRALRRAHQSRLGTGAAQALLPLVQFRTAGRRHR